MRSDGIYRTAHRIKIHSHCMLYADPDVEENYIRFTPRLTSRRLSICRAIIGKLAFSSTQVDLRKNPGS